MRFHFIRHGKRDHTIGDPSLTSQGREEAEQLARKLASNDIAQIFTSPLARTRQTAQIIAAILNLEIIEDSRLRERMNWGDLEGQFFDDFITQWERCSNERDYRPSVGDSSIEAGRRVEAFIFECYLQAFKGTVIGVTHGGVLADFLLNVFSPEELGRVSPGFCDAPYSGKVMRECSVTTIVYDGNRYRLDALGVVLFEN